MKNRIASFICILMILSMSITAYAIEVPELGRKASVSVEMSYMGEPISGGSLTAYLVAEVKVENGADHSFSYSEAYAECEVDISDLSRGALASELAEYTDKKDIAGIKLMINSEGKVKFEELELGLYLFVQEEAAEGYSAVSPFIASVPAKDGDSYVYDVDATPKISTKPEKIETAPPPETTFPETTTPSDTPEKLPQTGQTKWPVPILIVGGAMFLVLGIYLTVDSKRNSHEK